jgi:hypothetical protein
LSKLVLLSSPGAPERSESAQAPSPLVGLIADFLADLRQANHSAHTLCAYASDLAQFAAFSAGAADEITRDQL